MILAAAAVNMGIGEGKAVEGKFSIVADFDNVYISGGGGLTR